MPASSLLSMVQRTAIRNLARIDDFADIPYPALEPILRRIDNPEHLHRVEENCDQVADNSAKLWQAFIVRDVSNGKEKMLYPKNPRSWHKVYRKMMKEEVTRKAEAEDALRKTMLGIQGEKKETQFLKKVVPHKARPKEFIDGVQQPKGSSRPKYQGLHGPLNTIKRSATHFATQKVFKQTLTRNNIPDIKTQIKIAPKSMTREYQNAPSIAAKKAAELARKYAEPKSQIQKVFAPPVKRSAVDLAIDQEKWRQQQEREQRLRKLTAPGTKPLPSAAAPPLPSAAAPPLPSAAAPQTRATTATTRATAAASPPQRISTSTAAAASIAVAPRSSPTRRPPPIRKLSPQTTARSPSKNQGTPASRPTPLKSSPPAAPPMRRKRPAADPFMPATKRTRP